MKQMKRYAIIACCAYTALSFPAVTSVVVLCYIAMVLLDIVEGNS